MAEGRWSTEQKTFDYNMYGQSEGFKGSSYVNSEPIFQINPALLRGSTGATARAGWPSTITSLRTSCRM